MAEKIDIDNLVPMNLFLAQEPIEIDIVYANEHHPENIFGVLYHKNVRLTLQKSLAKLVVAVARQLHDNHGMILILKDGLRTYESQIVMQESRIVKDNPQWLQGPNRFVSSPGVGGHPRGVAIDVSLRHDNGNPVAMGTAFDEMTEQSARDYQNFKADILQNRRILEKTFLQESARLSVPIHPLSSEWWDFRYPKKDYNHWEPLHEDDVPPPLRLLNPLPDTTGQWQISFDKNVREVLCSL